ncbi:hypothetical protein [Nocardia caishijiensis]|uniref:Lipoprotein n=1 Tax=Nocardia caishijiensis TaxID=184756 RepID=A0ABQ6YS90_9NOCA|nr:hypothetical protein [Nocardia caishijiensis]KAF0848634.1 hypothetical protein FNL39_10159 [Nocardia caishijiensis]
MLVRERMGLGTALVAVAGTLALAACTNQVPGTAEANLTDLAAYTSEVAASSTAKVKAANDSACDGLRAANKSSVASFNAYIEASNNQAPDTDTKANEAVPVLRNNAKDLDRKITPEVIAALAEPLRTYRDKTNLLADTLERRAATDELNGVIDQFNTAKDAAIEVCRPYGR